MTPKLNAIEFVANENECQICLSYDHKTADCKSNPIALEDINTLLNMNLKGQESKDNNSENSSTETD